MKGLIVTEHDLIELAAVGLEALIGFADAHPEYAYAPEIQIAMRSLNALGNGIATAGAMLDRDMAVQAGTLVHH